MCFRETAFSGDGGLAGRGSLGGGTGRGWQGEGLAGRRGREELAGRGWQGGGAGREGLAGRRG